MDTDDIVQYATWGDGIRYEHRETAPWHYKGTVFEPLTVVDRITGRHYRLTIPNIQNNQMYVHLSEAREDRNISGACAGRITR